MKIFDKAESDRIESVRVANDNFEEFYAENREEWDKKANSVFDVVKGNFSSSDSNRIIDGQALSLSYRQMLQEEIAFFLNKRSRETSSLKKITQEKFIFYATGFNLKTNTTEKTMLIEGNIRENERTIQLLDVHIEFLRNTDKNLESFQYSVKNMIQLLEYLSR